jgi:limonene-1,2-epoxide hydrolase
MVVRGFVDGIGSNHFKVKMLATIPSGDTVVTERIDDLCDASGKGLASPACA